MLLKRRLLSRQVIVLSLQVDEKRVTTVKSPWACEDGTCYFVVFVPFVTRLWFVFLAPVLCELDF